MIFVYDPKERYSFSYIYSKSKIILKYLNEDDVNNYSVFYKNIEVDKQLLENAN